MNDPRARRSAQPRLPKKQEFDRALQEERIALLRHYVFEEGPKHLRRLLGVEAANTQIRDVLQRKGEGGPERVDAIFDKMPMMDQHARMLAQDAVEPARKPQAQDFFDFDHATAPPVYADAFVTLDRRLATLARNAKRGSASQIESLDGLAEWLGQVESSCRTAG